MKESQANAPSSEHAEDNKKDGGDIDDARSRHEVSSTGIIIDSILQ